MARRNISILLIDDSATYEPLIRRVLESVGSVRVIGTAHHYENACRLIDRHFPDLIIVDIGIRNGNGMEFIRRVRLKHPDIRVLVYTEQDEHLYAERALRIGAHGYLMKTTACTGLPDAVRTLIQGNLLVSHAIEEKILRGIAHQPEMDERDPEKLLSNRELEIFVKIGEGLSSREIADQLALSVKTVETHRAHIKRKLNLGEIGRAHV